MALDNQQTNNLNSSSDGNGLPVNPNPPLAENPPQAIPEEMHSEQAIPTPEPVVNADVQNTSVETENALAGYNVAGMESGQSSDSLKNDLVTPNNQNALDNAQQVAPITNESASSVGAEPEQTTPTINSTPNEAAPVQDMTEQIMAANSLNVTTDNMAGGAQQTQPEPMAAGNDIEIIPGKLAEGVEPIPVAASTEAELPTITETNGLNVPDTGVMETPAVNQAEPFTNTTVANPLASEQINVAPEGTDGMTLDQLANTPKITTTEALDKLLPQSPAPAAPLQPENTIDMSLPPLVDQEEKKIGGKTKIGLVLIILICVVIGVLLLLIGLALSPSLNLNIPIISDLVSSLGL